MIKNIYYLALLGLIFFSACKSDSPVTPTTENTNYTNIFTAEQGNTKYEIWSTTSTSSLMTGYNDVGFKVYVNSNKISSGSVSFTPVNYSFAGLKSSPVSRTFSYDAAKEMFTGYMNFFIASDTGANYWIGWLTCNGSYLVDSVNFVVHINHSAQVITFPDISSGTNVYMTLMQPMTPKQSLNDFNIMVHKSADGINFYEADSLEMYIKTWMPLMGHSSSDNINPVASGSGVYKGKINFNMSGSWYVYDSLKFNNNFITPSPAPKFDFECP